MRQDIPPPTSGPLVAAKDLSVRRDGRLVLDRIDFAIRAGEIVTLIGPNGGGKTTLVRALLGLVPIAAGTVARRSRLKVGYVPQQLHIDRTLPLTVRRLMTLTQRATTDEIVAALAETEVAHLVDRPVDGLSGGEFRRVTLARALLGEPELLVLDEPVAGVDFSGEIALYRLITEIRDRHRCGVVLVSHDLHIVMRATDRVLCLHGHICCDGRPEAVSRDPAYRRLFGHEGAETIAVYAHHHDHVHDDGSEPHHH